MRSLLRAAAALAAVLCAAPVESSRMAVEASDVLIGLPLAAAAVITVGGMEGACAGRVWLQLVRCRDLGTYA